MSMSARDVVLINEILERKAMQQHQERVLIEQAELNEKIVKLRTFLLSPIFKSLSDAEQSRLLNQERFMSGYNEVLAERIAAFQ